MMPTRTHPLMTPQRLRRAAVIYVRQSSPGQVRDHTGSADVQRAQEQLARDYGFEEIVLIDEDLGRSASSTELRTGLKQIVRLIVDDKVGAVFAVNASRLSRKATALAELVVVCRHHDAVLVLDGQVRDPCNPNDTAMLHMEGAWAELHGGVIMTGMREARLAKARSGKRVWRLPTGFIEGADGTIIFDRECYDAIKELPVIFWETGSALGTVNALRKQGKQLPVRYGARLEWKAPTLDRVMTFLLHESYTGRAYFGKTESAVNQPTRRNGHHARRDVPEEKWIAVPNLYPAYMTVEEQARIRAHMQGRSFCRRDRPGRGAALCQGLLKCSVCGYRLTVADPRPARLSHYYQCTAQACRYGGKSCMAIQGVQLDAAIERAVLSALQAPPVDVLMRALGDERAAQGARQAQSDAERKRLKFAEQVAHDRHTFVDPRKRLIAAQLEDEWEASKQALLRFETRTAAEAQNCEAMGELELQDLCALVSDIPSLWRHPLVTHKDRKEILRCVIDHILVATSPEIVTVTIQWKSGASTIVHVRRRRGVEQLIHRLHGEGMTVAEICAWLANGDPETGQRWHRTPSAIYQTLRRLGVTPNAPQERPTDEAKVQALYDAGLTLDAIVERLNGEGSTTARGRPWTPATVWHWLGKRGRRAELETLHREALAEAKRKGLSARATAEKFNAEGLPRVGRKPWTADVVRQRRVCLKRRLMRKETLREAGSQEGAEAPAFCV